MPDPGDTGYGDKGQGTSSSTGTTTKTSTGAGNTSGVGGGGGGGGGATGTKGSSTGSVGSGNGTNANGNTGSTKSSSGGNVTSPNTKMSNSTQTGGTKSSSGGNVTTTKGPGASQAAAKASSGGNVTSGTATKTTTPTKTTTSQTPKGPAASLAADGASKGIVAPESKLTTTKNDPYANSRRGPTGPNGEASQTTTQLRTPLGTVPTAEPTAAEAQNKYSNLVDISQSGFYGPDLAPNQMFKSPDLSGPALRSVVNGLDLAGITEPQQRIDKLLDMAGVPPEQRAGIMGNFAVESGFDPTIVGDAGAAYGIGQWRDGRLDDLNEFARDVGAELGPTGHPVDAADQAAFTLHELGTTEPGAYKKLSQTSTPEEAARVFSESYERPGTPHMDRRQAAALDAFEGTNVASAPAGPDPTRPGSIPSPSGSVYDTAGLSRPTIANPTQTAALDDTFAPPVSSKIQDRLPATEPSYFNDIANGYISPPQQAAAPVKPPNSEWVSTTADPAWQKEVQQATTTPPPSAPIGPATGQPYAGFTKPLSPAGMAFNPALPTGTPASIFTGGNSTFALPDQIPGFADQGRRLSIPGSSPATAAPANLPAQGQPHAAYTPPVSPAGMAYTPLVAPQRTTIDPAYDVARLASLAQAMGIPAQQAKQFADRVITAQLVNGGTISASLTPEELADPRAQRMLDGYDNSGTGRITDAAVAPSYMDDLAALNMIDPEREREQTYFDDPTAYSGTDPYAPTAFRERNNTYLDQGPADPTGMRFDSVRQDPRYPYRAVVSGEPQEPFDPATLMNQSTSDRMRNYRQRNYAVGVDEINPEPVSEDEALAEQQSLEEQRQSTEIDAGDVEVPEAVKKGQTDPSKYPKKLQNPAAPVKKPGKVATAALDAVQPGLGRLAGLIGVDDAINYVINRERNRPRGEMTPIGQRLADNAANRSSSDNQSERGGMQSNAYYDWILAGGDPARGGMPGTGTGGTGGGTTGGGTLPMGTPNQQQLDLIYSTFI